VNIAPIIRIYEETMKRHSSSNWLILPVLLVPLLVSACQPAAANSSSTPPNDSTPTSEIKPVEVELVLGTGPFYLTDPRQGLDDLSSFKVALTVSFEGSEGGQPKEWSNSYVLLQTKEPLARLLTIESNQRLSEEFAFAPTFLGELDGAAFEIDSEGSCGIDVLDPESSTVDWWVPAGLLAGLLGADAEGQEDMNGVVADHYTFDERALALNGVAESSGEVWVAADGGFILKYVLTTTGGEDYFGEGIEGTLTWDYALTDINQPLALELPKACLAQLVPGPRLPDATNVRSLPDWLRFNTSVSMVEASEFYKAQFPSLGWALTNEPPIAQMAELAQMTPENLILLEFSKADQVIFVHISAVEGGTEVNLVLSEAAE
jgi:hypothetical protein